ncbi:TM2 domain-containing protein [Arthrobacter sp. SLBN-100]|nr:TM2 domain-containing protein [Arthrobacter sp. SLBN-100]
MPLAGTPALTQAPDVEPSFTIPGATPIASATGLDAESLALAADLEAALNYALNEESAACAHPDADSLALAAELEAALNEALAEDPAVGPENLSDGHLRLLHAEALVNDEPVDHLPELPPLPTAGTQYVAMLESYGAFPPLLPAGRDFRPVLVLSVLLGYLGADRFYERKYVSGVLKLATIGGFGIWWFADIISILTGRARGRNGQPYRGGKKERVIAWSLTAALFAGLIPAGGIAATPAVTAATTAIDEALNPKPVPVPTWATLAEVSGTAEPAVLDITGDRLRLTYNFPGGVYAYLQKEGSTTAPAETLILNERPSQGQTEIAVAPGRYQLIVRADGTGWTLKAEERGLHG